MLVVEAVMYLGKTGKAARFSPVGHEFEIEAVPPRTRVRV
jgi:hypothetical protein